MQYPNCNPIEPKLAQAWMVTLPNREKLIMLVDPKFTIVALHQMLLANFSKFTVQRIDVGQMHIVWKDDDHAYCGDARKLDQDWEVTQ